jgi:hypothetical protein
MDSIASIGESLISYPSFFRFSAQLEAQAFQCSIHFSSIFPGLAPWA